MVYKRWKKICYKYLFLDYMFSELQFQIQLYNMTKFNNYDGAK